MLMDLISGQSFLACVAGGFVWRQGATRAAQIAQISVGAAKTRANCQPRKDFFFVEEDLSTGYFMTSFPFFQGSRHNSKLTNKKRNRTRGKTGR